MAARHAIPEASGFPWWVTTEGAEQTAALGRRLGEGLCGGEVILLYGPLGAGKTCLVQGLCRGLDITGEVVSPTFTLVNTYPGRLTVHHLDFYRLEPDTPLEDIGVMEILDEVADGRAVLAVEWPDPLLAELAGMEPVFTLLGLMGAGPRDRRWGLRGPDGVADDLAGRLGFAHREDESC